MHLFTSNDGYAPLRYYVVQYSEKFLHINLCHFLTNFGFFVHVPAQMHPLKYSSLQEMTAMLPCDTMLCSIRKTMDLGSFNLNKWTRLSQPTQWETCHLSPFTNSVFKLLMTLDPLVGQLTRIWPRPCPVHLQVCTHFGPILESIKYLNNRFGIQTEAQLWRLIKAYP